MFPDGIGYYCAGTDNNASHIPIATRRKRNTAVI